MSGVPPESGHPDLAGLLRGELGNVAAVEAATHARTCEPCHAELVDLALGHGLLSATRRTLGPVAAGEGRESAVPPALRRPVRRPWIRPAAAVAAAVLVIAGLGVALGRPGADRGAPVATVRQTAPLEPVAGPASVQGQAPRKAHGEVSMATDRQLVTRMSVEAVDLPRAPRGEFYYVWLLDPRTQKMLPLGQVVPGRRARFDLPEPLVESYSAIDISLEADDGDPGHSVVSVLRASYTPDALKRS